VLVAAARYGLDGPGIESWEKWGSFSLSDQTGPGAGAWC